MARYSNDRDRVERGHFMSVAVGSVIRKGTPRLRVNAGGRMTIAAAGVPAPDPVLGTRTMIVAGAVVQAPADNSVDRAGTETPRAMREPNVCQNLI